MPNALYREAVLLQMMQMLMQTHSMPTLTPHHPMYLTLEVQLTMNVAHMKPKVHYRECKHIHNYFIYNFTLLVSDHAFFFSSLFLYTCYYHLMA